MRISAWALCASYRNQASKGEACTAVRQDTDIFSWNASAQACVRCDRLCVL